MQRQKSSRILNELHDAVALVANPLVETWKTTDTDKEVDLQVVKDLEDVTPWGNQTTPRQKETTTDMERHITIEGNI